MNLYSPTTLQSLCETYHLRPSKQYGQNYLISERPIKEMIAAAELSKEDTVIEVGPGFGVLTMALTAAAGRVIAFEIEKKLQPYWAEHAPENLEIIWGNVLHYIEAMQEKVGEYKLVANLPYQITSQILRVFLETTHRPTHIIAMVQKEVAERICAKPGQMSLLAVSVQYYGTPKIVTKVSPGSFWPAPKVDSAVIAIDIDTTKKRTPEEEQYFFRVVKAGFANKRKQLRKNLLNGLGVSDAVVTAALEEVTGNRQSRAQELSIPQWEQLALYLASSI